MARRNDHSREELKAMSIAAGLKMIEEGSLSNMSLRKVAAMIEYTPGTIQNVFGSYTQLVLNINAVTLNRLQLFLQERISEACPNPTQSPEKALEVLTNAYIDFALNNLNAWQALFNFTSPAGTQLSEEHHFLIQQLLQYASAILMPLCQNDQTLALQHTRAIWASLHGICQLGFSNKLNLVGATSTHELALDFLAIYLKGLK